MKRTGFTIVELLIVVVVIAILAAISIVAYNGIQERAILSTLKSDIANAAKQMELANAETGSYPTSLPSAVKASSGNTLSLSQSATGFCVNGESNSSTPAHWRYESTAGGLQQELCSGPVIAGSETGKNPNLITNPTFASGWHLNMQNQTGRTLSTRPGTANDPFPTRPVLVWANNGTASTTWAVLQNSGINHGSIISGRTYDRTFWIRKTGPYTSNAPLFGVMTGGGTNQSFWYGNHATVPTTWQKFSGGIGATTNSDSSKVLDLPVDTSMFTTSGWTLEFQGFELRER